MLAAPLTFWLFAVSAEYAEFADPGFANLLWEGGKKMVFLGLREGFPKKRSCSFGFCPNEGGGAAQNLLSAFHKCIFGQ